MTYSRSRFVIIVQDKTTISVTSWHSTCTGHPDCIGDPAYIRTSDPDSRLLLETWLVLEVLRCTTTQGSGEVIDEIESRYITNTAYV